MNSWLGVTAGVNRQKQAEALENSWFCVPPSTKVGDYIYLYLPRSANPRLHGIFCQAEILTAPIHEGENADKCTVYGKRGNRIEIYGYCEIRFIKFYQNKLLAKDMKLDKVLRASSPVKRNFQFTCDALKEVEANRIISMLDDIN